MRSKKRQRPDFFKRGEGTNALHIAIATAPESNGLEATLSGDVRLLKPALLYGDSVTLYSPAAVLVRMVSGVAILSKPERWKLIEELLPTFNPEHAYDVIEGLRAFRKLSRRKGRSKEELLVYLKLRAEFLQSENALERIWESEIVPNVERMIESSGAIDLASAMSAGYLVIDPITSSDADFSTDELINAFVEKLSTLISKRGVYPLFDESTGSLVKQAITEGIFTPTNSSIARLKEAGIAADTIGRLPTFPNATVNDILDIRSELTSYLIPFRSAIIELGDLVVAAPYDKEFLEELDLLYERRIRPALIGISEEVESNTYLKQLVRTTIGDAKTLMTGILSFGIANSLDLNSLFVTGAATMGQAAISATQKKRDEDQKIKRRDLFFLYKTEQLLLSS